MDGVLLLLLRRRSPAGCEGNRAGVLRELFAATIGWLAG
jgi:hypothetical protein